MADALFQQADTNRDNRLDINEFRNLVSSGGVGGGSFGSSGYSSGGYGADASLTGLAGAGGGYSSYSSGSGYGAGLGGAADLSGYGAGGYGSSAYESSSYSSGAGLGAAGFGGVGGAYGADFSSVSGGAGGYGSAGYSSESTSVQRYATDAQGLFQDSNPQIIRKPAPGGGVTYKQNILVRFLQPPPIPPPGPLIIREVRPPQPPAPPPLVVRQRAPAPPQPPPLILRERPPPIPASAAAQTVIRRLPALPVPPRSVITERLPAPPPKPRDIIIERWIPYGAQAKRRTVVQRAGSAQQYRAPRNVIIQYEPIQARVVRQFQRLGIQQEIPQVYVQRWGAALRDSVTLVQEARSAGVVEDISPPAGSVGFSGASFWRRIRRSRFSNK